MTSGVGAGGMGRTPSPADDAHHRSAAGNPRSPGEMLVEKAAMLNLTVPEMTVLVGGMRDRFDLQ